MWDLATRMADHAQEPNIADVMKRDPSKLIECRVAKCRYRNCGNEAPSGYDLPFFNHKPDEPYDEYYCGCFGWD